MKERGILMSAPMVLATLADLKRQTRRLVKPQPVSVEGGLPFARPGVDYEWVWGKESSLITADPAKSEQMVKLCPHGVVGDRLWIREAYRVDVSLDALSPAALDPSVGIRYEADGVLRNARESFEPGRYRHARFMPRWASRITRELTEVRVERLQDISEEDARAEGLKALTKDGGRTIKYGIPDRDGWPGADNYGWPWSEWDVSARKAFATLWSEINGLDSWAANPWLWVLGFRGLP